MRIIWASYKTYKSHLIPEETHVSGYANKDNVSHPAMEHDGAFKGDSQLLNEEGKKNELGKERK